MRVDFTDRAMETLELTRELLWFEQILMLGTRVAHDKVANGTSLSVVISPDGETIYTTGMKHEAIQQSGSCENKSTPFGVRAIRAEDSRLLLEMDVYANQLSIASDGSRLFLTGWRQDDSEGSVSTDVFDLDISEFSLHSNGAQLTPARKLDGSVVLVSAVIGVDSSKATRMSMHDYHTGALIAEWISPMFAGWITGP